MNALTQNSPLQAAYPGCRGLTLVEILVALVILSIGLLGLAGLQTLSLTYNTGAYYRTQATVLSSGLADRMRANRAAALNDEYNVAFQSPLPTCGTPDLSGTVPADDIATWQNTLACRIPQSTGSVSRSGDEFTFTVKWDDSRGRGESTQFQFTTAL